MDDARVIGKQVRVRYDPFDASTGYAYILGEWRKCDCPEQSLAGCSERELQIIEDELRKKNRLLYGRTQVELTQKKLAAFRRENAAQEELLKQQQHDRETKLAFDVLEEGKLRKREALNASNTSFTSISF